MTRRLAAALAAGGVALSACAGSTPHARTAGASPPASASASHSRPPHTSAATAAATQVQVTTRMHLPVGVSRTVVAVMDGHLVVLGGLAPGDSTTARVWSVDTGTAKAKQVGTLRQAVHDASGAVLGGRALVFGGGAATTVSAVQAWNGTRTATIGSLPQPRSDSAAAVIGGTAYVVGGFSGRGMTRDVLATTDGQSFHVVGRLPIGVRYPAVAAVGGAVYVVGGALATTEGTMSGAQTDAVQRIDPATGQVRVIGHLGSGLGHATAFSIDGRLFVAGGRHGASATSAVVEVDLKTGVAHRVGRLPQAMSDAAVAVTGPVAWLVGGETSGPTAPVSAVLAVRLTA